jgi:hypothetical protein
MIVNSCTKVEQMINGMSRMHDMCFYSLQKETGQVYGGTWATGNRLTLFTALGPVDCSVSLTPSPGYNLLPMII